MVAACLINAPDASATFSGYACGTAGGGHCYSMQTDTTSQSGLWTAIKGTMNEASDTPGTGGYIVTSQYWLTLSSSDWVETGYINAFNSDVNQFSYSYFIGYFDTSDTYHLEFLENLTPNNSNHSFQISRGPTTNEWYFYFNGSFVANRYTPMWQAPYGQMGGEIGAPARTSAVYPEANTFYATAQLQTADGAFHTFAPTNTNIHAGLNGLQNSPGEWSWNTK